MQGIAGKFITAALCALLITGCSQRRATQSDIQHTNDALRGAINKAVSDPRRSARLQELAGQIERQAADVRKRVLKDAKQLRALNANYDTTLEEFQALSTRMKQERVQLNKKLLDTILQMRSFANEKEWKAISGKLNKVLAIEP